MKKAQRISAGRAGIAICLFGLIACDKVLGGPPDYVFDPRRNADAGVSPVRSANMGTSGIDADFSWDEETVVDLKERLAWQRSAPEIRYGWHDAQSYCDSLELAGGGWRLPTKAELLTVYSRDDDTCPFTPASEWYWSATPSANVPTAAWAVGMNSYTNSNGRDAQGSLRCVRTAR